MCSDIRTLNRTRIRVLGGVAHSRDGKKAKRLKTHCGVKFDTLTKLRQSARLVTSHKFDRSVIVSTNERYGTAVWNGLLASTLTLANVYVQWASVGEVAIAGGVSRGTAKKYLELLVEKGAAKKMKFGSRVGYAITSGLE